MHFFDFWQMLKTWESIVLRSHLLTDSIAICLPIEGPIRHSEETKPAFFIICRCVSKIGLCDYILLLCREKKL